MLNEAICDALLRYLGSSHLVAVMKFSNLRELRESLPLPSALLAAQRFEAAALSSRNDWVASGSLSGSHIALVVPGRAAVADWDFLGTLRRFRFADPTGGDGDFDLEGTRVEVPLAGWRDLRALFVEVDSALVAAELANGRDPDPNRREHWCAASVDLEATSDG